jgi:hypothetical protein
MKKMANQAEAAEAAMVLFCFVVSFDRLMGACEGNV